MNRFSYSFSYTPLLAQEDLDRILLFSHLSAAYFFPSTLTELMMVQLDFMACLLDVRSSIHSSTNQNTTGLLFLHHPYSIVFCVLEVQQHII